jgi:hypothetical protein
MDPPSIEPVARNHSDEMLELGVSIDRETTPIFASQNRDLLLRLDIFEQFARAAIQSVRNFE